MPQRMPSLTIMIFLGGLAFALSPLFAPRAAAQDEQRCFDETGFCISGRFLEYWQQNGGLPVFGYPLTLAREATNADGDTVLTQVFERQRFELHPENPPPYDVQLGRLGNDILLNQGYDWQQEPRAEPIEGCLYFEETGHNLCNTAFPEAVTTNFRSYWESNGLLDPALNAYGRSLALFGMPLTEPRFDMNSSGDEIIAQVFERARLELPISYGDGAVTPRGGVLQGRSGAEILESALDPEVIARNVTRLVAVSEERLTWIGGPANSTGGGLDLYTADVSGNNPQLQIPDVVDVHNLYILQIDGAYAYRSTGKNGPLLRFPLAGGDAETLVETPRGFGFLRFDDEFVYWTDISGFINRMPKNGGTPIELVQSGGQVRDLALDEQYIYWYLYDGTVSRAPKAGGDTQQLLDNIGDGSSGQIAVDEANVYVAYTVDDRTTRGGVVMAPKEGGDGVTLVSNVTPLSLALDDNNVYWTTQNGYVKAAPRAGGPPTSLVTAQYAPRWLFVNSRGVYWLNQNGALMYAPFG